MRKARIWNSVTCRIPLFENRSPTYNYYFAAARYPFFTRHLLPSICFIRLTFAPNTFEQLLMRFAAYRNNFINFPDSIFLSSIDIAESFRKMVRLRGCDFIRTNN